MASLGNATVTVRHTHTAGFPILAVCTAAIFGFAAGLIANSEWRQPPATPAVDNARIAEQLNEAVGQRDGLHRKLNHLEDKLEGIASQIDEQARELTRLRSDFSHHHPQEARPMFSATAVFFVFAAMQPGCQCAAICPCLITPPATIASSTKAVVAIATPSPAPAAKVREIAATVAHKALPPYHQKHRVKIRVRHRTVCH